MKKWIVSLLVLITICLFGCSNIESSETLDNSSTIKSNEISSESSSSKSTTSVGSTGGLISTNNYFDSQEFFVDYLNNCLWGIS